MRLGKVSIAVKTYGVCVFSRLAVTDWRLRRWRLYFLALMTATLSNHGLKTFFYWHMQHYTELKIEVFQLLYCAHHKSRAISGRGTRYVNLVQPNLSKSYQTGCMLSSLTKLNRSGIQVRNSTRRIITVWRKWSPCGHWGRQYKLIHVMRAA